MSEPLTLDDAIAELDRYLGFQPSGSAAPVTALPAAPTRVLQAWRKVRGDARRGRRISSATLPAVNLAAQHVAQARQHAEAALEQLGEIPVGRSEPPPPRDE